MAKKILIICLYLLIACIGISFAWMSASSNPDVPHVGLFWGENYQNSKGESVSNDLVVSSSNISFEVYVQVESGDYVKTEELPAGYAVTNLVPGQPVRFKFEFKNVSPTTSSCKFVLGDLTSTNNDIFSQLYFGITGYEGYPNNFDVRNLPSQVYTCIGDENNFTTSSGLSSSVLMEELYIPHTDGDDCVTLYGYILLNRFATSEYMGIQFSLGNFRAVA